MVEEIVYIYEIVKSWYGSLFPLECFKLKSKELILHLK